MKEKEKDSPLYYIFCIGMIIIGLVLLVLVIAEGIEEHQEKKKSESAAVVAEVTEAEESAAETEEVTEQTTQEEEITQEPEEAGTEDVLPNGRTRSEEMELLAWNADVDVSPYFDGYTVDYDDESITVNVWKDTYTRAVDYDLQNGKTLVDDESLRKSIQDRIEVIHSFIETSELPDTTLYFNLVDDTEHEKVLVSAVNEEIVYSIIDEANQDEAGNQPAQNVVSLETTLEILDIALSTAHGDNYRVEVEGNIVNISVWQDGIIEAGTVAKLSGDATDLATWNQMVDAMIQTQESYQEMFNDYDMYVVLNVLNNLNLENTILTVTQGTVVLDFVNDINLLGLLAA